MHSKTLIGLLAGLAASFLTFVAVADDSIPAPGLQLAQSSTETGQSGVGVRGTTGETSEGGQTYPGGSGTSEGTGGDTGSTDTGAGETGGSPGSTDTGGATSMGQPGSPENHVQEAMKHAKAAADTGQKSDAATVVQHAQMAKSHVQAAQQDKPDNPHLKAALKSLDNAIIQGTKGNANKARKAAHEAATHLNAIK
jgi:hypothetical protein